MNKENYEVGKRKEDKDYHLLLISTDREGKKSYWKDCTGEFVDKPTEKDFDKITCKKCRKSIENFLYK